MKFKLTGGAELDLVTPKELDTSLRSLMVDWMVEAAKGPRHIRWTAQTTVAADGTLTLGGTDVEVDTGRVGPEQNMVWSVKRITIDGLADGEEVDIFINSVNHLVVPTAPAYNHFGSDEFVLLPGDKVLIAGDSLTAGELIRITGSAWELPVQQMYRLM